jgi:hypothetical protein
MDVKCRGIHLQLRPSWDWIELLFAVPLVIVFVQLVELSPVPLSILQPEIAAIGEQ